MVTTRLLPGGQRILIKKLYASLEEYGKAIQKELAIDENQKDDGSGIVGNPIREEALIRQFRYAMISYSPEELIIIAKKENDEPARQ